VKKLLLKQKLLFAFLAVALLPLLGSFVLNVYFTFQEMKENTKNALHGSAVMIAASLDNFIIDNLNNIRTQSLLPDFSDYLSLPPERRLHSKNEKNVIRILDSFRRHDHIHIISCSLFDASGKLLLDTFGSGNGGEMTSPGVPVLQIFNTGLPVVSDLRQLPASSIRALDFFSPIRNARGDIVGILRTTYNSTALQKIVVAGEGRLGAGSLAVLIDERGTRIADSHDQAGLFKTVLSHSPAPSRTGASFFDLSLNYSGETEYLCAAVALETKEWSLIMALPRATFFSVVKRQIFYAAVMLIIITGMVTIAAFTTARKIAMPMIKLRDHAEEIGRGNLDRHVEISSRDEIGQLAATINEMTVSLASSRQEIMAQTERLRRSEEKYREVVESANSIILRWDSEGRIIFMNPFGLKLFGYTWEELKGRHVLETIVPATEAESQRDLRKMIREIQEDPEKFLYNENENIKKNGERVWISWTNRAILGEDGRLREILSIGNDITEKRRLQTQLIQAQKLESIGTLAGGIAHDFNNLLMGIQGYASLVLFQLESDSPHRSRLMSIEKLVESGAHLTRRLLGFARGGKYEVKATNINELIAHNAEIFSRAKREIEIDLNLQERIWGVEVDRSQMEQVFLNLYINAWQAMPGGGRICVATANLDLDDRAGAAPVLSPGRYVMISVADTGVGMDERIIERIFDPFFTTKEIGRGSGLGLASVYGIIKNHGGHIEVTSRKGQGTTFFIYLPALSTTVPAHGEIWRPESGPGGKEQILVVDDDEDNLDILQQSLESLGYRVLKANNGREAVEIYQARSDEIDMVVIDMIMPGMDGGEVFDRLKAVNPGIRAILASGYSLDEKAKSIMAKGVRAFIQKPFRVAELSARIREAIAG